MAGYYTLYPSACTNTTSLVCDMAPYTDALNAWTSQVLSSKYLSKCWDSICPITTSSSSTSFYKIIPEYRTYHTTASTNAINYCDVIEAYKQMNQSFVKWIYNDGEKVAPISTSERMRQMFAERRAPAIILPEKRKPIIELTSDVRELRARQTLRRVIGEDHYRSFMKNGFVTVRGKSGRFYQVFPGHDFTRVFENGKVIEDLCVVLTGGYTPTDALLMRYILLLNDEEHFRSLANRHGASQRRAFVERQLNVRPLTEIIAELRGGKRQPTALQSAISCVA